MKFSETFGITRGQEDDWFDPILTVDTRLFIDPFLLYASETGVFSGSHQEVLAFFNSVFRIVAASGGVPSSSAWLNAVDRLLFPEVSELCLGYTGGGTAGVGASRGFAKLVTGTLWEAIQAGITELRHFEEVGILGEGIGADRISDITACILRSRLAQYTETVCLRHNVPTEQFNYQRGRYDLEQGRWVPLQAQLPRNPVTDRAVLLVPRRYIRALPTINADDFWDYCYNNDNETLRRAYGDDISRNVNKKTIVEFARTHADLRRRYEASAEASSPTPYDFRRDQQGHIKWYDASANFVDSRPLNIQIDSESQFVKAIEQMVEEFKHYVEQNGGWHLLVNDNGTPRREKAAQDLFLGTVAHYCRANNIDVNRESNIGRGPVDFKMSQGYRLRVLHEVKLAKNGKFWHGLETQLPVYQRAERVAFGYFIVIVQSDLDLERLADIQARVSAVRAASDLDLRYVLIDSRRPPSASVARPDEV